MPSPTHQHPQKNDVGRSTFLRSLCAEARREPRPPEWKPRLSEWKPRLSEWEPRLSGKESKRPIWLSMFIYCCVLLSVCGTGCRQRAFTELYVENMASEIRMLEDRIYEYDAAYMEKDSEYESMRHEVELKKREIAELQRQLDSTQPRSNSTPKSPSLRLKDKQPRAPTEADPKNVYELPPLTDPNSNKPETITDPPVVSRTPVVPPANTNKSQGPDAIEFLPPGTALDLTPPAIPDKAKGAADEPQAFNQGRPPKRKTNFPSPESLVEQVDMPESMVRSAQQPKFMIVPSPSSNQDPSSLPSNVPILPSGLPSLLPKAFPKIQEGNPQGAIQRGMIRLPEGSKVQLASAAEPLTPLTPKPITDKKVVDIGFHPTMCHGHNFDEVPGDDGLYLVVTPMNTSGQILNQSGGLTVIVEDPAEPTDNGRIGAWEFTSEQLAETLEPIGAAQGFHLSLPWQEKKPTSKTVTVYLRYTSGTDRVHVNQREVQIRVNSAEKAVWTPRKTTTK